MKLTLAEVRRRLPVGTEYVGELLGAIVKPEMKAPMRRKIIKQSAHDMASELLEGPNQGKLIYLGSWKNVAVREENGSMIFANTEGESYDFMKVTLTPA